MDGAADRLMRFLGARATAGFTRFGYSPRMTAEAKREAEWWLRARGEALSKRVGLLSGWGVVWTGPGVAELVPIEVPLAGPGEVTVEVIASAVSPGTERAYYLRLPGTGGFFPLRPGYSAAGLVRAAGDGVSGVSAGDLVAVTGLTHSSVGTIPARSVHKVPAGVPAEDAAMVQLGVIAAQGIRQASIGPGDHVVVLGAGLIGALAQRLALAARAGETTVIARSRAKEAVAREGGVARFLEVEADADEIEGLAAPVVIEATGDPGAVAVAIRAAGRGGRVVLLGSPRGVTRDLPVGSIRDKRLRIVGAHADALAGESGRAGEDVERREAAGFLRTLATGGASVSDLAGVAVDPRDAGAFYKDLVDNREIVGARFDWTRLAPEQRAGRRSLLRLPDVSGRGVESERTPLPTAPDRHHAVRRANGPPHGRLRFGLLGCGDIGSYNAAAVAKADNSELVACYDPSTALAKAVADSHGAAVETTAEALFERRDVDAVFLSVPHHLHAPLALQAAEYGRHIIVEKPLANNLAAAQEMIEAAERANVVLSVCFPLRYKPEVVAARRMIAAGALGEFGGAVLNVLDDKPASYWLGGFSGRSVSNWRTSREQAGGGALIMNLSHYIDLLYALVDTEVDTITAAASAVDHRADVEDTVSVTLRYANGAVASLFGCTAARGARSTDLRLWGRHGQITLEPRAQVFSLRGVEGVRSGRWNSLEATPGTDIRAAYVSRFVTAVLEGRPPDVCARAALKVQATMEAAYQASLEGTSVRPADLLEGVMA